MSSEWLPFTITTHKGECIMNSVGIDVSKGKSTVAIMRPFGEIVASPFEINHTEEDFEKLVSQIKSLKGEARIVMEYTGRYYEPLANYLYNSGLYISVVNAILIHDYDNSSIRRVKTDKKDAIKIANYGLNRWLDLPEYIPEEELRQALKIYNRQFTQYTKLKVALINNLIALSDQTFPGIDGLFGKTPRKDGHQKWIDFIKDYWHKDCITTKTIKSLERSYQKWCSKNGYHYQSNKVNDIYQLANQTVASMPANANTKLIITETAKELISLIDALEKIRQEMNRIASQLPEYPAVMFLPGVGTTLGPQLIAEIGDIRRFHSRKALIAYAGIDSSPYQSGTIDIKSRGISKRGSSALRKTLFIVMDCILRHQQIDDPVYQFLDKKRAEGKHYYVYMIAGCNKFLRIYYARISAYLNSI